MTQARELPPLYMVIDSDDTEYKYATYEDAVEAFDTLFEIWQEREANYYAFLNDSTQSVDEDELGEITSTPEPYVQKWNAIIGEWEALDW